MSLRNLALGGIALLLLATGCQKVPEESTADELQVEEDAPSEAKEPNLLAEGEAHFANLRQLTFGGENAEAYWGPDGDSFTLQSTRKGYSCDQIFVSSISHPEETRLVSTGEGRTTCAYFDWTAEGKVIYSSTHKASPECPAVPDHSRGYVWPIYPEYEIFTVAEDGSSLVALTDNDSYDAEATVCTQDGSMVFTSMRDGDLDLYRMDSDGDNVVRLTQEAGYDGGAFFSADCSKIVWRASRPEGVDLEDYQRLLQQGLIRPSRLELFVADADGSNAHQVTELGVASFAPFFFPNGERIIFSSNHGDEKGREFQIWAVNVDGSGLEQITFTEGFDGFPIFSPDGSKILFSSNRNQGQPGETNVFVADWVD